MVHSKTGRELAAQQKVNLWPYPGSPESELRNWHVYLITDCHAYTLHTILEVPTLLGWWGVVGVRGVPGRDQGSTDGRRGRDLGLTGLLKYFCTCW